MRDRTKQLLSDLALVFVAFLWGGGFLAVKDALTLLELLSLHFARYLVAVIVMRFFFHHRLKSINFQAF